MDNYWILRWDTQEEARPSVIFHGARESSPAEVHQAGNGNLVVFEGLLFNRPDLEVGQADSNAAFIARAYAQWGEDVVDRLRGDFTLAIWDEAQRNLVVARDAMGLRPCFYYWNERLLLVSTALPALLEQPEVGRRFNRVVIAEYLQRTIPTQHREETFFENIRRLPSAHLFTLQAGKLRATRYWDPVPPGFKWATEAELTQFQPMLERSVGRCLAAGADSLGLSGGFDSVSLAILAAEQRNGNGPLHAVSLRFAGTVCDESDTQTAVARTLGMPQTIRTMEDCLDGNTFVGAALALSKTSPSPVISIWQSVYTGLLSFSAPHGLKKLLMGTGGDDLFNVDFSYGADRLAAFDLAGLWRFYQCWRRTSPFNAWYVARLILWERALKAELHRGLGTFLGRVSPRAKELIRRRRREQHYPLAWISASNRCMVTELIERSVDQMDVELAPGERTYVATLRRLVQSPLLMLELDQGFAWANHVGFTLLYPYFDRELVELSLRMHPEYLIAGGRAKAPLRRLVAERLPSVPLRSKKVDFTQIVHNVLRPHGLAAWRKLGGAIVLAELGVIESQQLNVLMEDYFAGNNNNWLRTWSILSTEHWLRALSGAQI